MALDPVYYVIGSVLAIGLVAFVSYKWILPKSEGLQKMLLFTAPKDMSMQERSKLKTINDPDLLLKELNKSSGGKPFFVDEKEITFEVKEVEGVKRLVQHEKHVPRHKHLPEKRIEKDPKVS